MSDPNITVDLQIGTTGAVPTDPAVINQNLQAYLEATVPGYTILPGLLIEDILSTDIAAIAECDQAAVENINSLTPNSANAWLLYLLGQVYGVPIGQLTNTSVYVVFSGTVGFIINKGFTVGNGTYQFVVQDGGVINSDGSSQPLLAVSTSSGSFAVPAGTVTALLTSVPGTITLSVTNPNGGIPSAGADPTAAYRARVMDAGLATAQGMPTFLKTQIRNAAGTQSRLISAQQVSGVGWKVIVGGGDPYQVASAIYAGIGDISTLIGSTIHISGITNANPGVVTTDINHGLTTGQNNVHIAGVVGMTGANGGPYTVSVLSENTFSFGVDTTGFGSYISGGVVTPNARNISVNLIDYPDTYEIIFVVPPAEPVQLGLTWNTDSPNLISDTAVAQIAAPALAAYVITIPVGQPFNAFQANAVFTAAISALIPIEYISRLVWTVTINGVSVTPVSGTGLYYGDPESFLTCQTTDVTVTQG